MTEQEQMLPIGALLKQGELRVIRHIASGGFGNTYEVEHIRLGKRFAVKEFFMRGINLREGTRVTVSVKDNRDTFIQMREKFHKEAQRLAKLEESHIVEVTDFFDENDTAYYVMKLIDGESLAAMMKRTGQPFSEEQVRQILPQMLKALKCVHAQGLYHLDLKPGNIMRAADGHCWLIDFGASKQLSAQESQTLSTSTGLCYTPGYAPSEQISGNMKRIGPWTDFYALGATLYNLLTNQAPPEVDDVKYDGESAFHFLSTVSDEMRNLVLWLMQPDYPKRPQTVGRIMTRLNMIQQNPLTPVEESSTESVQTKLQPKYETNNEKSEKEEIDSSDYSENANPKKYGKYAVIALIALALISGVIFFMHNSSKQKMIADGDNIENIEDYSLEGLAKAALNYDHISNFHDGLALVVKTVGEDYKSGYIDKMGNEIIPCIYEFTESTDRDYEFHDGMAYVYRGGMDFYIDTEGKEVFSSKEWIGENFSEGLAYVMYWIDYNRTWQGFIDKNGKQVISFPDNYRYLSGFSEGMAAVIVDGKYGYIDKKGNWLIPPKFEYEIEEMGDIAHSPNFHEGFAVAYKNGKYGYIDKNGNEVIPCAYDYAYPFSDGMAVVMKNGKYGYVDKNEKEVIPCYYDEAMPFSEGYASVEGGGNDYIIDKNEKGVFSLSSYSKGYGGVVFHEGLAAVYKTIGGGSFASGFIDTSGKEVIPCIYTNCWPEFSEGLAAVQKDGVWGFVDTKGNSTFDFYE